MKKCAFGLTLETGFRPLSQSVNFLTCNVICFNNVKDVLLILWTDIDFFFHFRFLLRKHGAIVLHAGFSRGRTVYHVVGYETCGFF